MSSPLIHQCEQHHREIIHLLRRLRDEQKGSLSAEQRRILARQLRQRLSRHLQMERHILFPLLQHYTRNHEAAQRRVQYYEQTIRGIIPLVTEVLHAAESHPEQNHTASTTGLLRDLQTQFLDEERNLHAFYQKIVPPTAELQQMEVFRRRLEATAAQQSGAHRIPTGFGITGFDTPSRLTPPSLDRQAVTTPVGGSSRTRQLVAVAS